MIVGFTGTQSGMTRWQKEQLKFQFERVKCSEFVMGDCIGADYEAAMIAIECGVKIFTIFPPDNPKKRAFFADTPHLTRHLREVTPWVEAGNLKVKWYPIKPYLERNKDIVNHANIMLAAPKEHKHTVRSGTWSTIRYAWHTKKDIIIIPPMEDSEESTEAEEVFR